MEKGDLVPDFELPDEDGTPRKLMSGEKLASMGWRPSISLENGVASTYAWFREHHGRA